MVYIIAAVLGVSQQKGSADVVVFGPAKLLATQLRSPLATQLRPPPSFVPVARGHAVVIVVSASVFSFSFVFVYPSEGYDVMLELLFNIQPHASDKKASKKRKISPEEGQGGGEEVLVEEPEEGAGQSIDDQLAALLTEDGFEDVNAGDPCVCCVVANVHLC